MFAKSKDAAREIAALFRARQIQKYYVAVSRRRPSIKQGSVVGDMARGRRGSWMLQRTSANPAITRFASTAVPGSEPGTRAYLLKPETGRTHQLRVAMKSMGAPVAGDSRYGNAADAARESRAYLHCAALRCVVAGRPVQVVCPPSDGAEFLSEGFRSVFEEWFPPGIAEDPGLWFPENKLLRSSLEGIVL